MTVRRIGLVADTHGLVRPAVHGLFAGVELILHAGDVGGGSVLDELGAIAPVLAVRGNIDEPWDQRLRDQLVEEIAGVVVRVTHGDEVGSPTPARLFGRYTEPVIIFGHSHRAVVERRGGRLAVNPGSAGPRRFRLQASVAILEIGPRGVEVRVLPL